MTRLQGLMVPEALAEPLLEEGGRRYRANPDGLDRVEFLLAAGPAEPLRPLSAVASGGERSRIMLALKAAPAAVQSASPSSQAGDALEALPLTGAAMAQKGEEKIKAGVSTDVPSMQACIFAVHILG